MPRKKKEKPTKEVDGVTYEGFFALPEPPPEIQARVAADRHVRWFDETGGFKLLLVKINEGKPRQVLEHLYGNANATMNGLRDLLEEEPLTPDALRKTIEHLNNAFLDERLPIFIERERGGTGRERVWLNVRDQQFQKGQLPS